jgi:hypothetical protein
MAMERGHRTWNAGAVAPEERSVTRAFYGRGCSDINVEPLDEYFDKSTQETTRL